MTREQLITILQEGGWENPSKLAINSILNSVNDEKKDAIAEAIQKTKEEFKDFKSPEDYGNLEKEIETLKDSGAKAERISKLKLKGISEKYLDFADGVLKNSKDFDKELEKYQKNYPEQFEMKKEVKEHTFENMGDGKQQNKNKDQEWNQAFLEGLGLGTN